jgi:hypothetical protein
MKRKTTRRRSTRTKKGGGLKTILILGAAAGGGYLAWQYIFKPMFTPPPSPPALPPALPPAGSAPGTDIIAAANEAPVNEAPKLSPKGTPDGQLKYDLPLKEGDKGGEIEKLQKILNVISGYYNTDKISVDGVYGPQTKKKLYNVTGKTVITLNQALNKYQDVKSWYESNN